jgi:hypothetical protein
VAAGSTDATRLFHLPLAWATLDPEKGLWLCNIGCLSRTEVLSILFRLNCARLRLRVLLLPDHNTPTWRMSSASRGSHKQLECCRQHVIVRAALLSGPLTPRTGQHLVKHLVSQAVVCNTPVMSATPDEMSAASDPAAKSSTPCR